MLSITREFRFEAAHRLVLPHLDQENNEAVFGACSKNHGHSFRLQVTLCGTANAHGWLLDFSAFEDIVRRHVLAVYDHADLNTLEDFKEIPPTAENLARAVFFRLRPHLQGATFHLRGVVIFETCDTWAQWEEDNAFSQ